MDAEEARRFALSLPEATEQPHFESASFRIRGRIFATLPPQGDRLHVFVDEDETRAAVEEDPAAFHELWWGKKLSGVRVDLAAASVSAERVSELIEEAWRRRAPKRVVAAYDAARGGSG
ncbi:MAG: hypothetical protein QOJ69_2214 [Actinomycetota bacterium]|nr:hypothetical protein [Actinomycetota bacterium]